MNACRAYSVNEMLLKIMGDQVRIQCMALSQAGLSIDEINENDRSMEVLLLMALVTMIAVIALSA